MKKEISYIFGVTLLFFVSAFIFTAGMAEAAEILQLNLKSSSQALELDLTGDDPDDENQQQGRAVLDSDSSDSDSTDKGHAGEIDILSATDDEPKTTGIEHEDIGAVTGTPDGTTGIDNEDIGITAPDAAEQGEKTTSGKAKSDMVIKGSTIKENYVVPEGGEISAPEEVETNIDLQNYLQKTAYEDENIKEIKTSDEEVTVKYKMPTKLFGFIPVSMAQEATITFGDGEQGRRVKVKFPWWRIFTKEPVSKDSLEELIEDELEKANLHDPGITILESQAVDGDPDRPVIVGPPGEEISENVTLNFAKIKARAFQLMSNVMKTKHDAAKSAVNNIR